MATLDATTQAEYAAEVNASDRAQVIVDALTAPVYGRIYNADGTLMGSGTMTSPWATVSGDKVIPATLSGFFVSVVDDINDFWYFLFESGSRYVRLSFGLSGSGKEAEWSLPTFDLGTQAGISPSEITVTGNRPPVWSGAPSTAVLSPGGTQDFSVYASDPDGDVITFSLVGATGGYSITSGGILTVGSASQSVTIRVTDSIGLYADHVCAVTVATAGQQIKWNPGFYVGLFPSGGHDDGPTQRASDLSWFQNYANDSRIKGFVLNKYLRNLEGASSTAFYDYTSQSGGVNYGGFAMVDYYLGLCATYNKRLILYPEFIAFGGPDPLPTYWTSQGWKVTNESGKVRGKLEDATCNSRWIAMLTAYAARYNAHPRFEMIGCGEFTYVPATGYTTADAVTQWKRMLSAVVLAWPRTLFRSIQNFAPSVSQEKEVLEHVEALNLAGTGAIIVGGPDHEYGLSNPASPVGVVWTNRLWRGQAVSGVVWKDVRQVYPWMGETQERAYTASYAGYLDSATNICTYHIDTMKSSHVTFYNYNNWSGTYAAIQARNGVTNPTPPSCLTGRTVTGGT